MATRSFQGAKIFNGFMGKEGTMGTFPGCHDLKGTIPLQVSSGFIMLKD